MNVLASHNAFAAGAAVVTADRRPEPAHLHRLQYLRAVAAVSVLLCHASYYVREYRGDPLMWGWFARGGAFGVVLFFAISGYLMARISQTTPATRFLAHRLIRIYPIYWLCVFGIVAASYLLRSGVRPDPFALALIPGATRSYVLGVEWTLPFELTFYVIVFAFVLLGRQKRLAWIGAAWIAVIESLLVVRPDLQHGQFPLLLHVPFSQYSLAFAGGLIVPFAVARDAVGRWTLPVALGALAASQIVAEGPMSGQWLALGCVLLVGAAVRPPGVRAREPIKLFVSLGDWSYALYLCHVPIIVKFAKALPAAAPPKLVWCACFCAPLIAAAFLGRIDLAMYGALKRRIDASSETIRRAIVAVFLAAMLGGGAYTYVKASRVAQASIETRGLADRIQARLAAASLTLAQSAAAEGLTVDDTVRGYIDTAARAPQGRLEVQGWVADATGADKAPSVLFFSCGQFLGATRPQYGRADVAAALRRPNGDYGFEASLESAPSCGADRLEVLIVTGDKRAAELSAALP